MDDFINTIDILGDDAVTDSIIDRSIVEFKDNNITTIGSYAFYGCSNLATASFPAATTISGYAFNGCSNLTTASFPVATTISNAAFYGCKSLSALILAGPIVCSLGSSNALTQTPIASGTGYIYVPTSLVASYQAAVNWSYFSGRISAIEDSEFYEA